MPLTIRLSVFTLRSFFLSLLLLFGSLPVIAQTNPADPWEKVNRKLYKFNDTLDKAAVRPVAEGYQKIVPHFARTGISNFFNNLDDVNVVVNDVLQMKLKTAMQDSGRLLLNTTVGLGGFVDVASNVSWYKNYEDFGQTLGHWGVMPGPYVVLPFLGSSTVRDAIGLIPDTFSNSIFWITDTKIRDGVYLLERVDTRVYYFLADDLMTGYGDYEYVREALFQRREYLVTDGEVTDSFDEYNF